MRQVNQEILTHFSHYPSSKQNIYANKNRTAEQLQRDDSRNYVATSQFEWRPAPPSDYDPKKSQKESIISQENIELRTKLNEEIKRNNELMKHINNL